MRVSMRRLWRNSLHRRVGLELFRTSPRKTSIVGVYLLFATASTVALVLVSGSIVGRLPAAVREGAGSGAADRIWLLLGVLAAVLVAQQLLFALQEAVVPSLAREFDGALRERVMAAALAPPRVDHLSDSDVLSDIAAATTLGTARFGPVAAVESLPPLLLSLLNGLAMAAVVGWYRWWLGMLLAAVWLLARTARRRDITAQYRQMATPSVGTKRQGYFRQLSMAPDAAKEIRVFGLSSWVASSFREQWLTSMGDAWKARRRYSWQLIVSLIAVPAVHLLAFVVIVNAANGGDLDLRSLTILLPAIMGTAVMADPGGITIVDMMYAAGAATVESVDRLEHRLGFSDNNDRAPADRSPLEAIRFESVAFRYPHADRLVLDDLDLTLTPGRSLAIVGENGAGKTTLVRLLCGLLEPTSGSLAMGDAEISTIGVERWQSRCAVVWQDFARFPISARDNVVIGSQGSLSDDVLSDIALRAGLHDVVATLSQGWETPLSRQITGGADLSGGQWQRIALARALAAIDSGASLFVLDEPTANLDVRAEAEFYERFLEMTDGLTTLIISHRFATVRRADAIAVLERGRIVEQGTHNELLQLDGTYARLFRLQSAAFESVEVDGDA